MSAGTWVASRSHMRTGWSVLFALLGLSSCGEGWRDITQPVTAHTDSTQADSGSPTSTTPDAGALVTAPALCVRGIAWTATSTRIELRRFAFWEGSSGYVGE